MFALEASKSSYPLTHNCISPLSQLNLQCIRSIIAIAFIVKFYFTIVQDGVASFTCSCAAGWEGETCANNINDCRSDSCQNGGTCQVAKLCIYLAIMPHVSLCVTTAYRMESMPSVAYVQKVMKERIVRPTPMTVIPILVKMEVLAR